MTRVAKIDILYRGMVLTSVREQAKHLALSNKDIESITDIEGLDRLTKLEVLDLSHNHIIKLEGLGCLGNLTELYLAENQITQMEGLFNLKKLCLISLDHNNIRRIKGLDWLTKLDELDLVDDPIEQLEGLETLASLTVLALGITAIPLVKAAGLYYKETAVDRKPYILVDAQGAVAHCQRMDIERKKLGQLQKEV